MISVVVPIQSEGPEIKSVLDRFCLGPAEAELLIADTGARPETLAALREIGARVLPPLGTRGAALARAALEARGKILFFLHADS
ncbi:MAG: hypothetical protein DMF55_11630, partial [Acidobacteria bacterium]